MIYPSAARIWSGWPWLFAQLPGEMNAVTPRAVLCALANANLNIRVLDGMRGLQRKSSKPVAHLVPEASGYPNAVLSEMLWQSPALPILP